MQESQTVADWQGIGTRCREIPKNDGSTMIVNKSRDRAGPEGRMTENPHADDGSSGANACTSTCFLLVVSSGICLRIRTSDI